MVGGVYDTVATLCPACGTPNDAEPYVCPACRLDLRSAEADEFRALIGRLGELDRELWETGQRRQEAAAELGQRRWAVTSGAQWTQPWAAAPSSGSWPHAFPSSRGAPAAPEWSVDRVRSILLWVGAALLTVSALTFTTVAWTHLDNGGRALLLAAVTALCVGGALALRRRLPATAEAFTALSIALAVIDWQALRRAGVTAGISATASWAVGSLVVSAFAFALGDAVGKRVTHVANAILVPLAVVLAVSTMAGAAWSFALGYALIAGGVAYLRQWLRGRVDDRFVRFVLMAYTVVLWWLAMILALVAAVQSDTLAQALVPASVMLALELAPVALLRGAVAPRDFARLATLVCGLVLGALVVVVSNSFGPQWMVAWATVVAAAAVVVAPSLPQRWTKPAWVAGCGFGAVGLAYGTNAALNATFGPLAWLRDPWRGSLATTARAVFAGPRPTGEWPFGWPAVAALVATGLAVAAVATETRRRRALVSASFGLGVVAAITVLVACLTPVVAGASVGLSCAIATVLFSLCIGSAALLDRSRPQLATAVLHVAILPALAATGWAASTRTASIVVLGVACVVALFATAVAVSQPTRVALGALSGAVVITLVGVATAAAGTSAAAAGFAIVLAAGGAVVAGVHGRWRAPEGIALEVVGAGALVVGASLAAQQAAWFAGAATVIVPLLLIAALRRERIAVYSIAAGAASVGATWAWLATAHVTIVEAYTAPAAALALGVGMFEWRRGPARSWFALGPAIVLGLGPTLVLGIGRDDTPRTIVAAAMAFAIVALGAWKRLQAPLVLASVALVALAADTFGPAVARLPRWLPTAVVGLLLMWIGATFETRRERAKRATETLLHFG